MRGKSSIDATKAVFRGLTARRLTIALCCAVASVPATAQTGEIIVLREVGPRNAINPGTGRVLSVATAPDSSFFTAATGSFYHLSDADAAMVSSGKPEGGGLSGVLRMGLDSALGAQRHSGPTNSERATGGSGGGVVSGAIGLGMQALQNALGSVRSATRTGP